MGKDSSGTRFPALDGLRGWSVLLVMFAHFSALSRLDPGRWARNLWVFAASNAYLGLDVFFVLSGFLITGILLDSKGSTSYFKTFYARRVLRIAPLYYGFLIVYFVVLPATSSLRFQALHLSHLQFLYYWSSLANDLGAYDGRLLPGNTFHFWSLAVEEQFYFLWPLIVFACGRTGLKRVCAGCLIGAPLIRLALGLALPEWPEAAYMLTPARMDVLALGGWLALAAREPHGLAPYARWAKPIALTSAAIVLTVFVWDRGLDTESTLFQTVAMTASAQLAGAIVFFAATTRGNRFANAAFMPWSIRTIGQYSYGIYVVHYPLAYLLNELELVQRYRFGLWISDPTAASLAYAATLMLLSIAAGAVSWHMYEKHFLKLRRYVPYRYAPASPVAIPRQTATAA